MLNHPKNRVMKMSRSIDYVIFLLFCILNVKSIFVMENKFSQLNTRRKCQQLREKSRILKNINTATAYRHIQTRQHSTYSSPDFKAGFTSKPRLCQGHVWISSGLCHHTLTAVASCADWIELQQTFDILIMTTVRPSFDCAKALSGIRTQPMHGLEFS